MKQSVSRRGLLSSAVALPVASMVPSWPALPNDADARVWTAVHELLEVGQELTGPEVLRAISIYLKLLPLGDDAYGVVDRRLCSIEGRCFVPV